MPDIIRPQVVNGRHTAQGIYIGRPSPLGNPFRVGIDGDRDFVIAKYSTWLQHQPADSPAGRALARLVDACRAGRFIVLRCWCSPLPCHGDVIAALVFARASEKS